MKSNQPAAQYTMDEGAVAMHEMLLAYLKAGFTRQEAFRLIQQQIQLVHECPNHKGGSDAAA